MSYQQTLSGRELFLRDIILSAGDLVRTGFAARTSNSFEMKGPQDYLTETDSASEKHIREAILANFPSDTVFGEEDGGEVSDHTWIVDPVDGTANFARGLPHFCISIGYVHCRAPELGAIFNPITDELYFARRGHGATCNSQPIHVSEISEVESASVELGWSTRILNERYLTSMANLLDRGFSVRRVGSGALALAQVADGRSDAYAELHMNSWDCIPGLLLVSEAGGRVCEFFETGDLRSGGVILAAADGVADQVSDTLGITLLEPAQLVDAT